MQSAKLNRIRKAFAVGLLLFTIFSLDLTHLHSSHYCSGENCSVCYIINLIENNLKLFKITFLFSAAVSFCLVFKRLNDRITAIGYYTNFSLFLQKIRLND